MCIVCGASLKDRRTWNVRTSRGVFRVQRDWERKIINLTEVIGHLRRQTVSFPLL